MNGADFKKITEHLLADDANRLVVCVGGGYRAPTFSAKDIANMKPEGAHGLRIGKTFYFGCQLRLAHYAKKV